MKILAIIPARSGSKGVPGKNIKLLGGKPLLYYTATSALRSTLLTTTILSTDSDEIASTGKDLGLNVPFLRPEHLASDTTPTINVVKHALKFYENQDIFFDAVCILQPTTPFRDNGFIDKAIEKFISSKADTLISVLPVPHQYNPHWVFEENKNKSLKIATGEDEIIPRRQELPKSYYRDGALYIVKTHCVINNNTLFGKNIFHIESTFDYYVNIDTLEDWEKAENIIENNKFHN